MHALLLVAALMTSSLPEGVGAVADRDVAHPDRPTNVALSFSPLSTFMLGAVLEVEFRLSDELTGYAAGEFYGLWMGWGAQTGLRIYPKRAFNGFFIDAHARASNLFINRIAGGGLEVGSQHRLGRSRWSILWTVGADVGVGAWSTSGAGYVQPENFLSGTFTVLPKTRFMLGYQF